MAKKRKQKDQKKIENEDTDESLTFKHWIGRVIVSAIILFGIAYLVEKYLSYPVLVNAILAVAVVLMIGFLHEALHYRTAVKLGYKPKWYRTKIRMGFTIEHHQAGKWQKDRKKIAIAPYVVLIPLSIGLLAFGLYMDYLCIWIAGLGSLILHGMSYPTEGKEE